MKKLAALLAIVSVAVLAAPALSATNPFMDVPMNHWAYDAIGQLAAHGILSGYPDGLYKGRQATTRYEMASALARALAVVDMTKASKQDVEMLKRLVVEFKDELEALGVRVDELDKRVAVLEDRLGGWHIHGTLVFDVNYKSANEAPDPKGQFKYDEARIFFERTWGENDEYKFVARLRNEGNGNGGHSNKNTESAWFDRFFVEMPFFGDSRLTVGRFAWNWESQYLLDGAGLPATGTWKGGALISDFRVNGFGLTKNFGIGKFQAILAHPEEYAVSVANYNVASTGAVTLNSVTPANNWMLMLNGAFQFTERIGLDLGGQIYVGDNAEESSVYTFADAGDGTISNRGVLSFKNMWTIFAGLRFNFTDNVAFKGIYYHQKVKADELMYIPSVSPFMFWTEADFEDPNHWAVMFDIKQEALKFTSIWLEYGQFDAGFLVTEGDADHIFYSGSSVLTDRFMTGNQLDYKLKYWRIALGQQWTEKFATHIFYYGYNLDDYAYTDGTFVYYGVKPSEIGVGVQYKLNDYTTMGLNYVSVKSDIPGEDKDNVVRFRTAISF